MKKFKKMMALVIAMVMVIGTMSISAFAATGDRKVNSPISVQNLENGDQVKYYKVIEWKDGEGWALTSTYKTGLGEDADAILGRILDGAISAEDADKIAGVAATPVADTNSGANTVITNGTWTSSAVDAGLYMVAIAAGQSGTIYNPVFVAANWYNEGSTPDSANVIPMSEDMGYGTDTYSDTAMAKKKVIDVNKTTEGTDTEANSEYQTGTAVDEEANGAYTTDNAETVSFTIKTTIPLYADNYTKPQFRVKDTLTGMELASVPTVVKPTTVGYTVKSAAGANSAIGDTDFVIEFDSDDIKAMAAAQDVEITYTAKITDAAIKTVNQDDNTVTVEYSNAPDDETGAGRLKDKTNHFTFSIDASVTGQENESSTDVIKVGVDKDGNPIESEVTYSFSSTTHPALNGAEFELHVDNNGEPGAKYTNDVFNGTVTTGNDGRIYIRGLDVGKYWLVETKAPAGYIKSEPVPVEISAVIDEETVTEIEGGVEVTYKTNKLVSYTVTINGGTTSYTMTNSKAEVTKAERDVNSSDGVIEDKKGVELPSTGGMGTTLFYIIGAALVVGAGVILVTRRRMSSK